MTSFGFYQENKHKFADLFVNSKDLLFVEFNKEGQILFANEGLAEILGWESEGLNVSNIFDFRISEVERILAEKKTYFCEINLINKDKEFISSKTKFIKTGNSIAALSVPLFERYEENKSSMRLTQTLDLMKEMLLKQPKGEEDVFKLLFEQIKKLIMFDQGLILLLEGDSLFIKARSNINLANKNYRKTISAQDEKLAKIIKYKSNILENNNFSLPAELGLNLGKPPASVLAVPLFIREMVYGVVILINNERNFNDDDVKILESIASIASYIIKDSELSSVFKMQLKVLKDNIKERSRNFGLIKEQNKKILEADRIKNEFLANMSHELRTPLNAIIGFSEALGLKIFGELSEKQTEYIGDIHSSGLHLLQMINDLLDLSKIESGKMELNIELFDVKKAMQEAVNVVKPLAEKKLIGIKLNFDDENIKITADRQKFQQILFNLLSNAIKFTDEKGWIKLNLQDKKKEIQISVQDSGIGIPVKYQKKIFEKFQQVDNAVSRKTGSTGLGLTITKELAEMHGGKISVKSQEEKGATFSFTLPKQDYKKERH